MSRRRRAWVLLALAAVLGTAGCADDGGGAAAPAPAAAEPSTSVTISRGGVVAGSGCALLADDVETRRRGLMGRTDLGDHVGMVFTFPSEVTTSFWMRGTPLPLSIAFFDDDGAYVSEADMAPCGDDGDCPTYAAAAPYRYALEVRQGDLDDLGIGPGATLALGGPCS